MGDITFTAQTTFESAMRMQLQQQKAILAPYARVRDCKGSEKKKLDNLIDNKSMRKKTERHSAVIHDQTGWDGIWIAKPDPDYLATTVDNEDELVTMVDLEGGELMAHAGAYNRALDAAFLQGLFGNMITGKTGTTNNAFPGGQPDRRHLRRRRRRDPARPDCPQAPPLPSGLGKPLREHAAAVLRRGRLALDRADHERRPGSEQRFPHRAQAQVVGGRQVPHRPRRVRVRRDRAVEPVAVGGV
jgi:hypothetical protein